jgi:1-acyl-sn-glycerol-3-phosphate acyltransferase
LAAWLMRRLVRAGAVIFFLLPTGVVATTLSALLARVAPKALYLRSQTWLMQHWCRAVVYVLGIHIRVHGEPCKRPVLVACNHKSWLDIVVLGAMLHGAFISKAEIANWPLFGFFARSGARTLFISRGELRSFQALGSELIGRLRDGERVFFFPEGTVSGAAALLRFKPRLFAAALAAECAVQPVALAYVGGDGAALAPMGLGESFGKSFLRFFGTRRTEVVLDFLSPIEPGAGDPRTVARAAQERIAESLVHLSHKD